MTFLLDTNTCSYALRAQGRVRERLRSERPSAVVVSSITVAEAWTGARKSPRCDAILSAWEHFLSPFWKRLCVFDAEAAKEYGEIRAALELAGGMIGDRDCMLAAIARSRGHTVVTHNTKEFERIENLRVVDWF